VVRLLAPRLKNEDHTKDVDFSPAGVTSRWQAGLADMRDALDRKPWTKPHDPLEGFVLHDVSKYTLKEGPEE
jgi:NTE family protein